MRRLNASLPHRQKKGGKASLVTQRGYLLLPVVNSLHDPEDQLNDPQELMDVVKHSPSKW
jgi:hypothetical protein